MAGSDDAHPPRDLAVGGPRWNRLVERQRLTNEAMAVARPFNGIVAALRTQIAELRAILDRDDDSHTRTSLCNTALLLDRAVYGQQLAFADATRMLASSIADNDRISDTRNALNSAAAAIAAIQTALGKQRHPHAIGR